MVDQRTTRRVGRPPKYDWGDKREICYKLYVEEKRSADQIIKYFSEHFQLDASELPCRKGFLRQFHVWGFPTHRQKLTPEHEALVTARMKALWAQNTSQKDIRRTLETEGFSVSNHEFSLLWKKNGLQLRSDQAYHAPPTPTPKKRKGSDYNEVALDPSHPQTSQSFDQQQWQVAQQPEAQDLRGEMAAFNHDEATIRAQRLYDLQVDSDQKLQSGKRRRRIKGYGHLPPDPPGSAPRFASETSLDECKAYLHLSNEMYVTVRADFENICTELDIAKKSTCADGVWEDAKKRLVQENLHLSAMLHPLQPRHDEKMLALECICSDVTKRMRAHKRQVTMADANNILNLDPAESKAVRRSLYEILEANNFESRLICGESRWSELRQQWLNTSLKLQQAVKSGNVRSSKAVHVLYADVMKRLREHQIKRGEREVPRKNPSYGPGPGPVKPTSISRTSRPLLHTNAETQDSSTQPDMPINTPIREPRVRAAVERRGYYANPSGNLLMSLAQATGNIDFALDPALGEATAFSASTSAPSPVELPVSAEFSLSPGSRIVGNHPKIWSVNLKSTTMESLHQAATCKCGAAQVVTIEALVDPANDGGDNRVIETQEDLHVYLREIGDKARFTVLIQAGYA